VIFISGGTGYLGSYIVSRLLETTDQKLALLTRAKDQASAKEKLWKSLQLHMDQDTFDGYLNRIALATGDLTQEHLGLSETHQKLLAQDATSIIHCAASLNRKSNTKCAQINLMGTLHMVNIAKACKNLKRFSFVSTVAVAGIRQDQTLSEDEVVDWSLRDYDPYARTKKFCESLVTSSFPKNVETLIFRPSIVLGDSRKAETTQFDMARAFGMLTKLRMLPFDKDMRLDIVPANFVGFGIADIHVKDKPKHNIYHMSSGKGAVTYGQIAQTLEDANITKPTKFVPQLLNAFKWLINGLHIFPRRHVIYQGAALMKVFLPYLHFNTVFDNTRTVEEVGAAPAPFTDYCTDFYHFLKKGKYRYNYKTYKSLLASGAKKNQHR